MSLAPCEYKTGKKIGEGSNAIVKEAVHIRTGAKFAAKIISKEMMKGKESMIVNEINVLRKVSRGHPNIITLYDFFETPTNLYLVTDLCLGGELFDRIYDKGYYFEEDAADTIRTLIDAVKYLHEQNVVHRDIKPENLLFKSKDNFHDLLLADFGFSRIMDPNKLLMTRIGTPGYMAPEIIKNSGHGKPVDMWSIGVLTYFLLCGYTPFDGNTPMEELQNIMNARYSFEPPECWGEISAPAKDFIEKLLLVEPEKRMNAKQASEHIWLQKVVLDANISQAPRGKNLLLGMMKGKKALKRVVGIIKAVHMFSNAPEHPKKESVSTDASHGLPELPDKK